MRAEYDSDSFIQTQVNKVFRRKFGVSVKGRIELAACAIGDQVGILRDLVEERTALHQHIAAHPFEKFEPEDTSGQTFSPVRKAIMARDAALEGACAVYNLNDRRGQKALLLAETTFYLCNIADPNQN